MKTRKFVRVLFAVAAFLGAGSASAAAVSCGDATLGIRLTAVDPGLVGGLCYAQSGNLDNTFTGTDVKLLQVGSTSLTLIGKEVVDNGDAASPLLGYTVDGDQFGTWSVAESAWNSWSRVMLGFHFGGAGDQVNTNPDSFVIELASTDNGGTWELTGDGSQKVKLTGLSNIYLFGVGPQDVPEPAMLALVGLALLGVAGARRRQVRG